MKILVLKISKENKLKYADIIIERNNQSDNDLRKSINYAMNKNIKDIKEYVAKHTPN